MIKLVAALAAFALVGCGKKAEESAKGEAAKAQGSKVELAKLTVQKLAFEAYPRWAIANPSKACPDKLEELSADVKDPWGSALRMFCGPNAPAGVKGIGIVSNGPDQKQDTADDIKSWE